MTQVLAVALAVVLATDAGTHEPAFSPDIVDVHHGTVWPRLEDGGVSDAPRLVRGGIYMDDDTTMWVAENKARSRAAAEVGPAVDFRTVLVVGAVLFVCGAAAGAYAAWVLKP